MVTTLKAVTAHVPVYRGKGKGKVKGFHPHIPKGTFRYGNQSSPDVTGNFPWMCYPLGLDFRSRQ